jgi:hypothetical protein
MAARRTTTVTETDVGIDDDGTLYVEETEYFVTDDSRSGVRMGVRRSLRDSDGYETHEEVRLSGDDYVELVKAEAEDRARQDLRRLIGRRSYDED